MSARFSSKTAAAILVLAEISTKLAQAQSAAPQLFPAEGVQRQEYSLNYVTNERVGSASADDVGHVYYFQSEQSQPRLYLYQPGVLSGNGQEASSRIGAASSSRRMSRFAFASQVTDQKNDQGPPPPTGAEDSPPPLHIQIAPPPASGAEETLPPTNHAKQSPAPAPSGPPNPPAGIADSQPSASGSYNNGSCECGSCNCGSCDCDNSWCDWLWGPCCDQQTERLFDEVDFFKCYNMTLTGWLNGGVMGNGRRTEDHFNGPLTFADRRGEGQANQQWIAWDCSPPKDNCGWFVGGHVDFFFGSDYFFTTAAGLDGTQDGNVPQWNTSPRDLYGFAMPQLYLETDYGNDLKIKYGHFFTTIGYEVVPAIGNFFYSHSYTMQYGEPFTHTGILASATECNWTFSGGFVGGWNTFSADERAAFLGGLTITDKDWGSLAFSIITGGESVFNLPGFGPFSQRTMYSIVWSRNFTDRFTYVIQHDYGAQDHAFDAPGSAEWFGVNQYFFYKLNCCWTAGMRIEWFRDDDGFVVTGLRPGNALVGASFPGNFYEITAGLNYKPTGNLAIRPEVRWDWYDGRVNQSFTNPPITSPYNAGTRIDQFTYGVDLIFQF